jgi:hypothetical protein
MLLNIPERITLFDILPKEGHYADVVTLRRAREVLSLTAEEVKEINYREEAKGDGRMAFFDVNKAIVIAKDIPIDEWTTRTIQTILSKMEKDGKLSEKFVPLFEKFVINYE